MSWLEDLPGRLRGLADGTLTPAVPRDAATVLLLRDAPGGLEVFLVRRARSMAFAGGMHAFPGGSVEPTDDQWLGALPPDWPNLIAHGDEGLCRRLVGAAVRETWEECGAWLGEGPIPVDDSVLARSLRPELLRPWAHWITPLPEPRRFDTRFFLAALPTGQEPAHRGGEADQGRWIRPTQVAGLPMLPPTLHTLGELGVFASVAEAFAAPRDIRPIEPALSMVDGEVRLLLPWQEGYRHGG